MVKNFSQYIYNYYFNLVDIDDFFDAYTEIVGIEKLKAIIIKHMDELNSIVEVYEKKMRLLLPIKILIKPFRELCKFCKKHSKNKGD